MSISTVKVGKPSWTYCCPRSLGQFDIVSYDIKWVKLLGQTVWYNVNVTTFYSLCNTEILACLQDVYSLHQYLKLKCKFTFFQIGLTNLCSSTVH